MCLFAYGIPLELGGLTPSNTVCDISEHFFWWSMVCWFQHRVPLRTIYCAIGHIPHLRTRSHPNSEVNVWRGPLVLALETDRKHETANRPFGCALSLYYILRRPDGARLKFVSQWYVRETLNLYAQYRVRSNPASVIFWEQPESPEFGEVRTWESMSGEPSVSWDLMSGEAYRYALRRPVPRNASPTGAPLER